MMPIIPSLAADAQASPRRQSRGSPRDSRTGKTYWNSTGNTFWNPHEQAFLDLADARRKTEAWRQHYNNERPHSSLGGLTPGEFAARAAGLQSPTAPSAPLPATIEETNTAETENVA